MIKKIFFLLIIVCLCLPAEAKWKFVPKNLQDAGFDYYTLSATSIIFPDVDGSPGEVGELLYDNTVAGFVRGLLAWHDGTEVRYIADFAVLPGDAQDDYVLAYDKDTDKLYFKADIGAAGGDAWGDPVDAHILPTGADNTYDLGSVAASFKDGYFQGTLEAGTLTEGGVAVYNDDEIDAFSEINAIVTDKTLVNEEDAITLDSLLTTSAGINLGTSQALVGTTAITIGNNGQTIAINSSDWGIGATGIATGMGNITSDGTIEGVTLTEGGNAVPNVTDNLSVFASTTSAQLYGVLSNETGSASGTPLAVFNQAPVIEGNIKTMPQHIRFNVFNPNVVYDDDTQVCIWPVTPAALTVTKITVTLDASGNEVAGDLKYADTFIGLASATVINDFDTTSGVREDTSITSATVATGKAVYIEFDSQPSAVITQMVVDVQYDYD